MKKHPLLKVPSMQVLKTLLIMKIIVALLFASALQVYANDGKSQERIDVEFNQTKLSKALKQIEKKTQYRFVFSNYILNEKMRVTLSAKQALITDVLAGMLANSGLVYQKMDDHLFVIKGKPVETVFNPISGKVVNKNGEPLHGVTITVKNGTATTTNILGEYKIEAAPGDVLTFSFVGYTPQTVTVGNQGIIDITMQVGTTSDLGEVVVTALGIKRKEKALAYATQKVDGAAIQTVKGVDIATSLSGKVAGLLVRNTTEFYDNQSLSIRGQSALLVVDGVMGSPVGSLTLRDIPVDNIETIDVLKGGIASALYGSNAQGGVIMITTKKGNSANVTVDVNSSNMMTAGWVAKPEVQTSYARGINGQLDNDYVWGPKLDIGTIASQWNPVTKKYENMPLTSRGKNNLENFMERGIITNNSISISQGNDRTNFRATFGHMYNKGQFPNQKFNNYNANISGEIISANGKFQLRSNMGLTKRNAPSARGSSGYGNQGYLYQLVMWTGTEYDIRQFRDYWNVPYQSQNWVYDAWYDNPYLTAYEKKYGNDETVFNYNMTMRYKVAKNLNLILRPGFDMIVSDWKLQNPRAPIYSDRQGWDPRGRFYQYRYTKWSTNSDAILSYNTKFKDFTLDVLGGGAISYQNIKELTASTTNGLIEPTFYSLKGSVGPLSVSPYNERKQTNSLYGSVSIGWRDAIFLDATGRNDWISTQPSWDRTRFYPSLGTSVVISELVHLPKVIDMFKVRGSWAKSQLYYPIYTINNTYGISQNAWVAASGSLTAQSVSSSLLSNPSLVPDTYRDWEIGAAAYLFKKRLHVDIAYFNKLSYNRYRDNEISSASGFSSARVNIFGEKLVRKGFEIIIDGDIAKTKNFKWNALVNWSNQKQFYKSLDSVYSAKAPWFYPGARTDQVRSGYWMKDPNGNVIHSNGMPVSSSPYQKLYGYAQPDFVFGFQNNFTLFNNFTLGINMDGVYGGIAYNDLHEYQYETGTSPETDNKYRYDQVVNGLNNYIGNGVKVISGTVTFNTLGQITSDTRVYGPNDVPVGYQQYARRFRAGNRGFEKTTYLKIREVSLGYKFNKKLFGKSGIKYASVSLIAQNVALFTAFKYSDPDKGTDDLNSPSQRRLGINFQIGF